MLPEQLALQGPQVLCCLSLRVCSSHKSLCAFLMSHLVKMLCLNEVEAFLVKLVRCEISAFLMVHGKRMKKNA